MINPVVAESSLTTGLVLRDFGIVVLIALAVGLVFHGIVRKFFRKPNKKAQAAPLPPPVPDSIGIPGPLPVPLPAPSPVPSEKKAGIDATHFTWWDFLVCAAIVTIFLLPVVLIDSPEVQEKMVEKPEALNATKQIFNLITQILVYSFLAYVIISMIRSVGMRDPIRVFGLRNLPLPHALGWILVGSSISILSVIWISGLSATYAESMFNSVETQTAVKAFDNAESPIQLLILSISAVILAPLFEELLFRGYLYGILKKFTEPMFAACLSGAIFGLIHMTVPAVLPLWFFGIFLALAYEGSRTLWVPIGIHAIFNGTQIIGIIQQKKQEAEPIIETVQTTLNSSPL